MQSWTPEMWRAALLGLVVGFAIGYFLLRFTKGSVKKQVKTETELRQLKAQLENQKQQLEKHFAESANLLKTLAQDYQHLYQHFAGASVQLLPELDEKALFQAQNVGGADETSTAVSDDQPKDYSEGSSGLLKAER
ncbi:hypothetical protein HMPREF9065_01323 [Aggregatibacter sp. oral taxon 458 str. W10330]|jgi:hypothetical protein|uniref:YhcB family protein n=1 Tax=unclassified Aggregatibacter TaxID=2639383 RepID=UPI000397E74C|nr:MULTISPECIES: DUF1043 family protein [unclassified Aggregatibacter]ERH27266.1 hypothetical protein HMPREF9065_01323 [Aggregatibacter sp. oral taxon 458 str. W10330]QTO01272.1 DUF1043 family protein [Aggregatibacter sp. 2125159857]